LVSAPASIIFENMYIGETRISPDQTNNEMNITLGNDPKISIRREEVQDKSGEKFLSSYREKVITYDLVIKNNKKEQISMEHKTLSFRNQETKGKLQSPLPERLHCQWTIKSKIVTPQPSGSYFFVFF